MRKERVFPVITFFALMSCDCVSAVFRALTQESPVVVAVGDTAVLRCLTSGPEELTEARWIRIQGGRYSIINIFKDGRDQQRCDLPEYIGRTEVMRDGLAHGRAALKLFNVSVADEGTYRCFLQTAYYFDFVNLELRVTALGSDPRIHIEGFEDDEIKVVCRSSGWYPEPTLVDKDDDGEMKVQKEEHDLYSIEYSKIITESSNWTFSCLIRTPFHGQERESSLYVTDDLFQRKRDIRTLIIINSMMLVLLLLVAVIILRIRQRKIQDASSAANTENSRLNVVSQTSSTDHPLMSGKALKTRDSKRSLSTKPPSSECTRSSSTANTYMPTMDSKSSLLHNPYPIIERGSSALYPQLRNKTVPQGHLERVTRLL